MAPAALEGQVLAAHGDRGLQKELLARGRAYSAVGAGRVVVVAPGASRKDARGMTGKGGVVPPVTSSKVAARAAKGTRNVAAKARTAKKR